MALGYNRDDILNLFLLINHNMEIDLIHNNEDEKKNYKAGVIKSVYLSICFMLLFSAFNSA